MQQELTEYELYKKVQNNINNLVKHDVSWSIPLDQGIIKNVKNGVFEFFLTNNKAVPSNWFPATLKGTKILCLAGAGGQQAPYLAAAGAVVTVYDLSENMLKKDEFVAKRDGLKLSVVQGNMCDLSVFADKSFDMIINPVSLMYVPDVFPVYQECYRVLRKNGIFICAVPNPINYLCDYIEESGYYKVCNKLPYRSSDFEDMKDWIEFGHTLESLIGGQIKCGFAITGFYEDKDQDELAQYSDNCFVTRAIKL